MDTTQFDQLAQALARVTRRGLLRSLAALPLAGGLFAHGDEQARGKKRRARRRGRRSQRRDKRQHAKHREQHKRSKRKVTLCQDGQTIRVRRRWVKRRLRQGAARGSCPIPPDCQPRTCAAVGAACGQIDDGCGGLLACGTCSGTTPVCADHVCVSDGANGTPCDHGGQCQSGFCTDGVCCASVECGQCQACNIAEKAGTCQPKPNGAVCGALNVCYNSVCAKLCGEILGCYPDTCTGVTGERGGICTSAFQGTCGCTTIPDNCPPGSICTPDESATCGGENGCRTIA